MRNRIKLLSVPAVALALSLASCTGQQAPAQTTVTTAATTAAETTTTTAAETTTKETTTTTAAETTTTTTITAATTAEPEIAEDGSAFLHNSFTDYYDVVQPKITELEAVTDESEFGHEDIVGAMREKCFEDYSGAIGNYNETSETKVLSPEDIVFVHGQLFDFTRDGTDDLIVNLFYAPDEYDDYFPGVGCVLYFADGATGDISEVISGGLTNDGKMMLRGSTRDIINEVWDYGNFTVSVVWSGYTPMSSCVVMYKNYGNTVFEELYAPSYFKQPVNGIIYRLDHASLGYQYLPAVITPDGEFKKLGFEQLTVDEFAELLENNEELKEKYTMEAQSRFNTSDLDAVDRVYVCGCSTMLVYCKSDYAPAEYYDYLFVNYYPDEYPPVVVDTKYDPELLYGVNLERLNVTYI